MRDLSDYPYDAMREPILRPIQHETSERKLIRIARLIEAMLDFALISGFLSAVGFLISITGREYYLIFCLASRCRHNLRRR
jgi:hypothetical protein